MPPSPPAPAYLVRDAIEADLPGILAIYNDVVATSPAIYSEVPSTLDERRAWHADRVGRGYPVLVAVDAMDGTVLGFSSFGDFRSFPGYRHTVEHSVHVRADARGRGIGPALVRPLFGRAAALGKHVMVAGIDAENAASIRMHRALGFVEAGTLREVGRKFGRWLDLLFMQRTVDGPARGNEP